jgi:hypothetical protein
MRLHKTTEILQRTIDSDSNALVECVPISANESRDLSKIVDL